MYHSFLAIEYIIIAVMPQEQNKKDKHLNRNKYLQTVLHFIISIKKLQIDKYQVNVSETSDLLPLFSQNIRKFINDNITISSVYELFPYSGSKYDPDKALIEIKESTNNLNTRLSNLKKINKSLIRFEENSSSLNWEDLQKISAKLKDEYKDN